MKINRVHLIIGVLAILCITLGYFLVKSLLKKPEKVEVNKHEVIQKKLDSTEMKYQEILGINKYLMQEIEEAKKNEKIKYVPVPVYTDKRIIDSTLTGELRRWGFSE